MGKKMDRGSPGMTMARRNVNISTRKEKETKSGQRGGQMVTKKLREITTRIKRTASLPPGKKMETKSGKELTRTGNLSMNGVLFIHTMTMEIKRWKVHIKIN